MKKTFFRLVFIAGSILLSYHVFRSIIHVSIFSDLSNTATAIMVMAGVGAILFRD